MRCPRRSSGRGDWTRSCGKRGGFYAIVALATIGGVAVNFTSIDPIKALFWTAVINGVIAVPIMIVMMLLGANPNVMGTFTIRRRLTVLGWLATLVMAAAVVAMIVVA